MGSSRDHSRAVRAELTLGDQAQRQLLTGNTDPDPIVDSAKSTCHLLLPSVSSTGLHKTAKGLG
jgi:hypothetical protein